MDQVLRNIIILIGIIGTAIIIVFAAIDIFITQSISRPIIELRNAANKIARGNLSTNIEIRSSDEIGDLATAFNKMVSDLKKSNDEIIAAKEYTDNIVRSMTDTLMVISQDGIIQTVNPSACRLLGYKEKELIGQPVTKVLMDYDGLLSNKSKNDLLTENEFIKDVEKTYISKNSREIPVIFSASKMYDNNKKILGIVCAAQDITERKRIQEELKESEEKYRDLFENANDAICVLDSDFNYKNVNNKAVELLGYSREELLSMNVYDIIPNEQIPVSQIAFQKLREKGSYEKFIGKINTKEGRLLNVEVSSSAIIERGKIIGSRDIIRDITERKQMEEKIIRSLQEKEVLLQEIHHRVKNNMQIISSLLMLQSQHASDKKDADIFIDSQNRIVSMALIHEKLYQSQDFSRIDFKKYIEDLVAGLFQTYRVETGNIALNINVENISLAIDSAIPCGLIINEVVTNSLKYAFPDGRKGEIKIALNSIDENMIELVMGDNGIGIPEDIDFQKTESLGLHLVRILAENQLHGEISLDRSRGTEFQIKFRR